MKYTEAHLRRYEQVMKWYAPARFGLFYHWGLYTGGGCTHSNPRWQHPLKYQTVAALEQAAPDPALVASNMVDTAFSCGAKYITLTVLHSCDGYCVIYPTRLPGFVHRTRLDYLGEFIRTAAVKGIRPIIYMPCGPEHWNTPGGPWLEDGYRDNTSFASLLSGMVDELAGLHGNLIGGFWIDGMTEELKGLPAHIHKVLPDAIVINNNNTFLELADVDYGTTEFLSSVPYPDYCRPDALRQIESKYKISLPGRDFNEDIPTCNQWWHVNGPEDSTPECWSCVLRDRAPYLADPNFLVRQMISSLGQRGQWNFALGIGPRIDGTLPPEFLPSLKRLSEFLAWGGEAVYGTTGGENSSLKPGWFSAPWSDGGFCSVTVSLTCPNTHYLLVTGAPTVDRAGFHTGGRIPKRVSDLRTGTEYPFEMMAGFILKDVDWSDVNRYGAKAFKIEFD